MKRKYLYRLIMITISFLFVPIMIISTLFWRKSLKELQTANDTYQEKILFSYTSVFEEMLSAFENRAAFLSAKSKERDSALFDGVVGLEEDYFRIYQITKELVEMNPYMGVSEDDWGIYLYDIDKIIKPGYAMNIENLIFDMEYNGYHSDEIDDFFAVNNYKWSKKLFCTTRNEEAKTGNLLIGVCTYMGTYQEPAMVYFVISPDDMEKELTVPDEEDIAFHLYDEEKQEVLLSWGREANQADGTLYKKETMIPNMTIMAYVSEDTLQQDLYEYAANMGKFMVAMGIVLFLCCLGAVYISYKPIKQLTSGLELGAGDEVDSEITAIKNVMQRDRTIIEEQESTIRDLLLSHLLYGGHISAERMKRLGIDNDIKYYSVFMLCGQLLATDNAKELVSALAERFDSRLFIIDITEQNRSVFVLFSKAEDVSEVHNYMKSYFVQNSISENDVYFGKVVDTLDDIQLGFKTAMAKEKKAIEARRKSASEQTGNTKIEKQKKLISDILAYLEAHFREADLGQVQVADAFQISNYNLSRIFKTQVGVGFAEYLIDKRLTYAKQLLLETDMSINDIAVASGFSSVHYFSRMFKASTLVTPSAFRKEKGQILQDE